MFWPVSNSFLLPLNEFHHLVMDYLMKLYRYWEKYSCIVYWKKMGSEGTINTFISCTIFSFLMKYRRNILLKFLLNLLITESIVCENETTKMPSFYKLWIKNHILMHLTFMLGNKKCSHVLWNSLILSGKETIVIIEIRQ